ncbi:MAG TPA: hypothetical protein VF444_24435 [Pseudonocardiaceae bacterium]
MPELHFGFEEDDEPYELKLDRGKSTRPAEEPPDSIPGTDPDEIVTVRVNPEAQFVSVRLVERWKDKVSPEALAGAVRAAANAAIMAALARRVEETQDAGERKAEPAAAPRRASDTGTGTQGTVDPMTNARRLLSLLDTVSAQVDRFEQQLSTIANVKATADSGGRHVRAGIEGGQVIEVTVDTRWAERVRYSEVESELLDALRQAQRRADPGDLTRGPQSTEISELMNLVNNPQELLRQLGLGN